MTSFLIGGFAVLIYMTIAWLISLPLKNSSIVDSFWGLGFVLCAAIYAVSADGYEGRKMLILILVIIWGLRLSGYIAWRNGISHEDFRYRQWREEHGAAWWWYSYLKVFLLQGVILWIVSVPILGAMLNDSPNHLSLIDALGVILWGIGFFFEAVGDFQLAHFKNDPANKGKVMNRGLWHYTRHPNYFGDALVWWGFYLIALAGGGWWTIFSPILMTYLLMKVSGVAMLERSLKKAKPEYQSYIESTSAFFPWFPQ